MSLSDVQRVHLASELFTASLPEVACDACGALIPRRAHRMQLRPSWLDRTEYLCLGCWAAAIGWAARFALRQLELPLS